MYLSVKRANLVLFVWILMSGHASLNEKKESPSMWPRYPNQHRDLVEQTYTPGQRTSTLLPLDDSEASRPSES